MNRCESTTNTYKDITNTNDPQRKYRLRSVSKNILLQDLNRFHGTNRTHSSDVDQDTYMFGLHERPLTYPYASTPSTNKSRYKKEIEQIDPELLIEPPSSWGILYTMIFLNYVI